jgi:hypothetical protein
MLAAGKSATTVVTWTLPVPAARPGAGRAAPGLGQAEVDLASGRRARWRSRSGRSRHPGACGVFLGDLSYVGTTGDLPGTPRRRTR